MKELIWLNGEVGRLSDARVDVEDRGFQFADGVYEVTRVYDGRCFALRPHIDRMERSAAGIKLALPIDKRDLCKHVERLVEQSELLDGIVYVQMTRGRSQRNHVIPKAAQPTLLFYTRELPPVPAPGSGDGASLVSVRDVRWRLCWIKSIALLANVLARTEAAAAGAEEAVFVDDFGVASECSTSNLFAVINGALVTHPVGEKVLPGITRDYILDCTRELNIPMDERPMTEAEAISADEIFISSTTREISWVSQWNGKTVGPGACGQITLQLHRALRQRVRRDTAVQIATAQARGSS
jgi:D-alanine transaminase